MRVKELLLVTAVVEFAAGLTLMVLPAVVLAGLLGIQPATVETMFVGRIAAAALLAIGIASFLARNDARTPAQCGLLSGILIYNVLVALLLVYAGFILQLAGLALWPVAVLHTLLAGWCVLGLQAEPPRQEGRQA